MTAEKRKLARRNFSYYMRILDETSGKLVGHLADISTGGFKLDCSSALPLNKEYRLRIELTSEVANKSYMVFTARSRWCATDPFDPLSYNVGFQIVNMNPSDYEIFSRMFEKYSSKNNDQSKSNTDYLWK
jgi:hypothetical protein